MEAEKKEYKFDIHPKHKEQIDKFINDINPSYLVTLNFSVLYSIRRKNAIKEIDRFLKKLNNFLFGRRSKKQLRVYTVLEMGMDGYWQAAISEDQVETNWHFHLLIENPYERSTKAKQYTLKELKKIISDIWGASNITDSSYTSRHDSDAWFKPIHDQLGSFIYTNKESGGLDTSSKNYINEMAFLPEYTNVSGLR